MNHDLGLPVVGVTVANHLRISIVREQLAVGRNSGLGGGSLIAGQLTLVGPVVIHRPDLFDALSPAVGKNLRAAPIGDEEDLGSGQAHGAELLQNVGGELARHFPCAVIIERAEIARAGNNVALAGVGWLRLYSHPYNTNWPSGVTPL